MKDTIQLVKRKIEESLWQALKDVAPSGKFATLLQGPPNVRKFFRLLRKELVRPEGRVELYRLCLASYVGVNLLEPYQLFEKEFQASDLFESGSLGVDIYDLDPKVIWQAIVSSKLGKYLPGPRYDPKIWLGNIPGSICEYAPDVRLFYTACPTIDDTVLPEAHGLLQGMQEGSLAYRSWIYVNLQDLTSPNEKRRSQNIMRLNFEYPETFYGITLAQNSGVYCYPAREALLDKANFTLDSHYGYFFPATNVQEEKRWHERLEYIINQAERVAKGNHTLFCDLVHLGIIAYFVKAVPKRAAIFNATCKESIDRGAKINAYLLWATGGNQLKQLALCCLHARAISTRNRQIRPRRLREAKELFCSLEHGELSEYLTLVSS